MKKLRLSYSLLHLWSMGRPDDCVKLYFHMDMPTSRQMEEGKTIHKQIQDHIVDKKEFPGWFFNQPLKEPVCEKEVIVSYNEIFDLKVLIDCFDSPNAFEFKTGVDDSLTWARTAQIPIYFLACELAGIPVNKFYLIRWNQYEQKKDWAVVWNSDTLREYARNYIDSLAPDIHAFFESEGLI